MIRRFMPFWVWGVVSAVFLALSVGISVGFTVYWVHAYAVNQCEALNILIEPRTGIHNVPFRDALIHWADSDGCR